MNRRTCSDCGGRSYYSGNVASWDCPYCKKDLSETSNDNKPWRYSSTQIKLENMKVPFVRKASIWPNGPLALFFCIGITLANSVAIPGTYSYMSDTTTTSIRFRAMDTFPAIPMVEPELVPEIPVVEPELVPEIPVVEPELEAEIPMVEPEPEAEIPNVVPESEPTPPAVEPTPSGEVQADSETGEGLQIDVTNGTSSPAVTVTSVDTSESSTSGVDASSNAEICTSAETDSDSRSKSSTSLASSDNVNDN